MNLVIVDDDSLVSLSLKTILEASGAVTVLDIGKNGREAIALYDRHQPDVLLMDIRMDTMTGLRGSGNNSSRPSRRPHSFSHYLLR